MASKPNTEELQSDSSDYSDKSIAYAQTKKAEVKSKILEYSDDFSALTNYLETRERDEAVNQFKHYVLAYLKSNEETMGLFARFKTKKRILFFLNALVIVLILVFRDPFFEHAESWLHNTKDMLDTIPYQYYTIFNAIFILSTFTSCIILLFCMNNTECPFRGNDIEKELYLFDASYDDATRFLNKKFRLKIINKIILDLLIIDVIFISAYSSTLIKYNYGLNLFIITSSSVILTFSLTIISLLKSRKLITLVDEIYDSRYL